MNHDYQYMRLALREAEKAMAIEEVPVGIVVCDSSNLIIFQGHNVKEKNHNIFGHAEMDAIEKLSNKNQAWRLNDLTFYVTLEPCVMCMASLIQARIKRLVFGAYDSKGGAISLGYNFCQDSRLNHRFQITGGLLEEESSELLRNFFKIKRQKKI